MGTRQGVLAAISDPNILIFFVVGLAGLYFELSTRSNFARSNRWHIALTGIFRPVHIAGKLYGNFNDNIRCNFIYCGDKVMSHGILTIGGVISLIMGSLLLFDTTEPALRISLQV